MSKTFVLEHLAEVDEFLQTAPQSETGKITVQQGVKAFLEVLDDELQPIQQQKEAINLRLIEARGLAAQHIPIEFQPDIEVADNNTLTLCLGSTGKIPLITNLENPDPTFTNSQLLKGQFRLIRSWIDNPLGTAQKIVQEIPDMEPVQPIDMSLQQMQEVVIKARFANKNLPSATVNMSKLVQLDFPTPDPTEQQPTFSTAPDSMATLEEKRLARNQRHQQIYRENLSIKVQAALDAPIIPRPSKIKVDKPKT